MKLYISQWRRIGVIFSLKEDCFYVLEQRKWLSAGGILPEINFGDTITLRTAYDDCRIALNNSFKSITLKQITRGAIFAATEQYTCETLLRTVKLTNTEEVRDTRTVHQAKGTERLSVLVCLEGRDENETQIQIDHILNPAVPSDEQQPVTYVAISRARDRLFLTTPALTTTQEQRARALGIAVTRLYAT